MDILFINISLQFFRQKVVWNILQNGILAHPIDRIFFLLYHSTHTL